MSRIRAADTRPEMLIRRGLHAGGLRYRLHDRRLPGTPDIVFGPARAVIFVHGCFWHGHECALGVRPRANAEFWDTKIARNRQRDEAARMALQASHWRVATVWECALRGRSRLAIDEVLAELTQFVHSDRGVMVISGRPAAL